MNLFMNSKAKRQRKKHAVSPYVKNMVNFIMSILGALLAFLGISATLLYAV